METSCRDGACRDMYKVSGRTLRTLSFVNYVEVLLMTIASDDLASDDVSLGALLQTRYFRHSSSDTFFKCNLPDALSFK